MTSLCSAYRAIVCDLDGVVYRSHEAIPYAVEALERARDAGLGIAYATNNAARPPATVAAHLRELGLTADDESVVTSSMAGAAYLAERLPAGSTVLAVGGDGVALALTQLGLRPVRARDHLTGPARAVLQGFGVDVGWPDLAEAAYAIQAGAQWVATNLDLSIPTSRGIAPGNGALVAAVGQAVHVEPYAVGKPQTPLYELCATRLGVRPQDTLAVGDRMDTDIIGANRTGMPALCVTTGVDQVDTIALADGDYRPRYLATDLRALHRAYQEPEVLQEGQSVRARCGDAVVTLPGGGAIELNDRGDADTRLRAVVLVVWHARDLGMEPPSTDRWSEVRAWIAAGGTS